MTSSLNTLARRLAQAGKGVLAADESNATLAKRFDAVGIPCTPENRCAYRTLLFSQRMAMSSYISGVILFDETIRQDAPGGIPIPELIAASRVLVGIKVDAGLQPFPNSEREMITRGLDQLGSRLGEYKDMGATFAKWRAVFAIDPGSGHPSSACIEANAEALAHYAALVQSRGMVPIVEPEVLMDGDHNAEQCYEVTLRVLEAVVSKLWLYGVALDGMILKPNMIVPGEGCRKKASLEESATLTLRCLRGVLPPAVPGVLFLSGGQSDVAATEMLNILNTIGGEPLPWRLSFSYGRALQARALRAWAGRDGNVGEAQRIFCHRARMNSLASLGQWNRELEGGVVLDSR